MSRSPGRTCEGGPEATGTLPPMLRRRRLPLAASTALVCGSLALSACSGDGADATGGGSGGSSTSTSTSDSTTESSSSGASPSGSESSTTPDDSSTTPDPYAIDCALIPQSTVDEWVRGGKAASVESTDTGCRVVGSSQDGAVIIEWRWLDVVGSGGDASALRSLEETGGPVTVASGIPGTRTETDVAPTRNARVAARIKDRMLYIETTVTLDRKQTLQDMRRITSGVAKAYADTTPPPHEAT